MSETLALMIGLRPFSVADWQRRLYFMCSLFLEIKFNKSLSNWGSFCRHQSRNESDADDEESQLDYLPYFDWSGTPLFFGWSCIPPLFGWSCIPFLFSVGPVPPFSKLKTFNTQASYHLADSVSVR